MSDLATELAAHPHGRVPRELRERQVLALAGELFAERGYVGASMDELATRAGVSKPVIYDLVGSKEELFRSCVDAAATDLYGRVAQAVAATEGPEPQLRAGAMAFFAWTAEHRRSWGIMFADGGGEFARDAAKIRARQTELVIATLTAGALNLGVHVDEQQIEAGAHMINGAFEALAHWATERPEISPETLSDWFVALMLPGLQRLAGGGAA
jgi:AcrR family transcriptional regulator